jgi:3-oxoacyl-(acyl-carrier-protein) synthase
LKALMNSGEKVWITGIGAISCLGPSVDSLWQNTLANQTGIIDGLGRVKEEFLNDLPEATRDYRALAFCVRAAQEAMSQAGWTELGPEDGLILATTTGHLLEWDFAYMGLINGRSSREEFRRLFINQPLGELLNSVAQELGHSGPSSLLTSACSASTQALALGAMWIRQGKVKRCLVAGVEVLCDLTCEGFRSLQLLSTEPATPFDRDRRGINLSEGAAFLCLEAQSSKPLAEITGFGFSTDGFHMTGPHPEGDGSYRAMKSALEKAALAPKDISWVHAHGTGSGQNDMSEGLAITRLFAADTPWVTSTKWLHGHALAASGALETALIVKAMNENTILHTRGLKNPDAEIQIKHLEADMHQPIHHVLKNTLGFGGANAAIVISVARSR